MHQVFFINEDVGWTHNSSNIYKTTDGGNNWILQMSQDSNYIYKLFFINENIGWYNSWIFDTGESGIFKTTNGGYNWDLQHTTGQFVELTDLQFIDSLNGWSIGIWSLAHLYLYKTTDGGLTWSLHDFEIDYPFSISFVNKDTGWVAGITIEKTTNSGLNWVPQLSIDPHFFSYIQFVNENTGWAYSRGWWAQGSIYKTTNSGQVWFLQSHPISFNSIFFADELNGWAFENSNIYYTSNGGETWALQFNNLNNTINCIFFFDQNNGWIVGNNGTIFHTTNGGTPVELTNFSASIVGDIVNLNWATASEVNNKGFEVERKKIENRSQETEWSLLGFVEGNGTTTEQKYYTYKDEQLSSGIYSYRIKQIDFNGTYKYYDLSETVEIGLPDKFELSQNYPNPFNPSTKIKFSIPTSPQSPPSKGGEAKQGWFTVLKIYDILGNEVATLVNEEKVAGQYEVEFNPESIIKNLPAGRQGTASGVYFYQLRAGPSSGSGQSFVETRKMILLK